MTVQAELLIAEAEQFIAQKQHAQALQSATQAKKTTPQADMRPWLLMAKALQGLGDVESAYCVVAKVRQVAGCKPGGAFPVMCPRTGPAPQGNSHAAAAELPQLQIKLLEAVALGQGAQAAERLRKGLQLCATPENEPRGADHKEQTIDGPMRVFCISDLHVDQGRNMDHVQAIARSEAFKRDVLVVAGDVADTFSVVKYTLQLLRPAFRRVVFVPGNHDLWLRGSTSTGSHALPFVAKDRPQELGPGPHPDSFASLLGLMSACDEIGVDVGPVQVHPTLLIVPLFSWYHYSFAGQQARPGRLRFDALCQWPVDECEAVWQLMLAFNKPRIAAAVQRRTSMAASMGCDMGQGGGVGVGSDGRGQGRPTVITCSHFLPRPDLPFHSHVPDLDKAMGCLQLEHQLEALGSSVHVYGHCHVAADMSLPVPSPHVMATTRVAPSNGGAGGAAATRRYVHNPLDGAAVPSLRCIWDESLGAQAASSVDFSTGLRV